jgi:hypothetical protein
VGAWKYFIVFIIIYGASIYNWVRLSWVRIISFILIQILSIVNFLVFSGHSVKEVMDHGWSKLFSAHTLNGGYFEKFVFGLLILWLIFSIFQKRNNSPSS